MSHTIFDYSLVIAVLTWVGTTGISTFRNHKNSDGKPTLLEIKEMLRASRNEAVHEVKESTAAAMRPVVETLERIETVNGAMRDVLIELKTLAHEWSQWH